MIPLRIFLGVVAVIAMGASLVGAAMSIKINWEFATTLGRNSEWGFYLALAFASVEGTRLLMPFLRRGLTLAELKAPARWAGVAFWTFTLISFLSAAGFFAMNRADSTAQRSAQLSQTKSFKAEVDTLTRRIEHARTDRSAAEIDALIKGLPRGDPDKQRSKLEAERAAAIQREADEKRLGELQNSAGWKTAVTTAVATTDAQIDMIVSALPFEKETAEKWVAISLITIAIIALELLVGFTPFAAAMVLVWALRRHHPVINAKTQKIPEKSTVGEVPGLTSRDEYSDERALADVKKQLLVVREISTISHLQTKWGWTYPKTQRRLQEWQSRGVLRLEKRGSNWVICRADPKLSVVASSA